MPTRPSQRPWMRLGAGLPLLLALGGCIAPKVGDLGELSASSGGATGTTSDAASDAESAPSGSATSTDGTTSAGTTLECLGDGECDLDLDSVGDDLDNALGHANPDQSDLDLDGIGDPGDLCPLLASGPGLGDLDHDGQGDTCDRCPASYADANEGFAGVVPEALWVVAGPLNRDFDGDGVGDHCDNCVATANCGDYDLDTPHQLGQPIPADPALCQKPSADHPFIGEACFGLQGAGAGGPVGFGPQDDFDQDGLVNEDDECPRDPVEPRACAGDGECPDGSRCRPGGICGHRDHDDDGVGDRCDTCPHVANPAQVTAAGRALDDPDGDRIGLACEPGSECAEIAEPRPTDFYLVGVAGACCVTLFHDGALTDPDGLPLQAECADLGTCRPIPAAVRGVPGIVDLPPGCDEAFAALGIAPEDNVRLTLDHPLIGGSKAELGKYECVLPPSDQDFDGLGDACDLCPFAFDPNNNPYIDNMGYIHTDMGKYCHGDYAPPLACTCP